MLILNVGKLKVNMSPAPEDGNTLKIISESQTCFFFVFFLPFLRLFSGFQKSEMAGVDLRQMFSE